MMKRSAGLSSRGRLGVLLGVLLIAGGLVWTDDAPTHLPEVVQAVAPQREGGPGALPTAGQTSVTSAVPVPMLLALDSRAPAIAVRDAFAVPSWRRKVVIPAASSMPVSSPGGIEELPPFPYGYLGKQHLEGRWEVFLTLSDRTLIVKEQDTIDGMWRVEMIRPPSMQLLYLPGGQPRTLQIGEAP